MKKEKRNKNINVGLVLAIFGILLAAMAGIASAKTYDSYVNSNYGFYRVIDPISSVYPSGSPVYYKDATLNIDIGDTVEWINDVDESLTIVNGQGLFETKLLWAYKRFGYTFTQEGTYDIYIKEYPRLRHQTIVVNSNRFPEYNNREFAYKPWGSYYTMMHVGEEMFAGYLSGPIVSNHKIIFDAVSHTGQLHTILANKADKTELKLGDSLALGEGYSIKLKDIDTSVKTVLISLLKNGNEVDNTVKSSGDTYIYSKTLGNASDLPLIIVHIDSVYVDSTTKSVFINGIFQIAEAYTAVSLENVEYMKRVGLLPSNSPTATTVAPTATTTTITPTATTTVAPTVTVTTTAVPTVTTPIQKEKVQSKRALLNVTFKVDRVQDKVAITIKLRNIGDDIARSVNFSVSVPAELKPRVLNGADLYGNRIVWKGDIGPNEEHEILYWVNPAKIDIELPIEITYIGDEKLKELQTKARSLGMTEAQISSVEFLPDMDPADLQKILLIIQIARALPGFEMVLAIGGILAIYIIRKKK